MNFTYKSFLLAVVLAFPFTNNSFAQGANGNIATTLNPVKGFAEATVIKDDLVSANTIIPNTISSNYPKLMKRFSALFQNNSNQQWTEVNQTLFVSFINNNGQKARACFTKDGIMNYAITDSDWKQLPEELQQHIKSNYPGYTVFNAIEIEAYNTTAHQVILEDVDGFITLKSTADGVEEITHVSKL